MSYQQKCYGPLAVTLVFMFRDGNPPTNSTCHNDLHQLLSQAGYQLDPFNTHSFRIGAATSVAAGGRSRDVAVGEAAFPRLISTHNHQTQNKVNHS